MRAFDRTFEIDPSLKREVSLSQSQCRRAGAAVRPIVLELASRRAANDRRGVTGDILAEHDLFGKPATTFPDHA